jgi:hypothetical protein
MVAATLTGRARPTRRPIGNLTRIDGRRTSTATTAILSRRTNGSAVVGGLGASARLGRARPPFNRPCAREAAITAKNENQKMADKRKSPRLAIDPELHARLVTLHRYGTQYRRLAVNVDMPDLCALLECVFPKQAHTRPQPPADLNA